MPRETVFAADYRENEKLAPRRSFRPFDGSISLADAIKLDRGSRIVCVDIVKRTGRRGNPEASNLKEDSLVGTRVRMPAKRNVIRERVEAAHRTERGKQTELVGARIPALLTVARGCCLFSRVSFGVLCRGSRLASVCRSLGRPSLSPFAARRPCVPILTLGRVTTYRYASSPTLYLPVHYIRNLERCAANARRERRSIRADDLLPEVRRSFRRFRYRSIHRILLDVTLCGADARNLNLRSFRNCVSVEPRASLFIYHGPTREVR